MPLYQQEVQATRQDEKNPDRKIIAVQ